MKTIAIIPAKGFSRRIPRKNMCLLGDKPLLQYITTTVLESACVDEVYVSTDDESIADFARSLGAQVPYLRDRKLSGDAVHGTEPVLDMLQWLYPEPDDSLFCLRVLPPYPFVSQQTITEVVKKSQSCNKNVLSVVPLDINMFHLKLIQEDGSVTSAIGIDAKNFQIEDSEELYALSGAAQCAPAKALLQNRTYHYDKPLGFKLPKIEGVEVDTPEALEFAERILISYRST